MPVEVRELPCSVSFRDTPVTEWELGGATIRAEAVTHTPLTQVQVILTKNAALNFTGGSTAAAFEGSGDHAHCAGAVPSPTVSPPADRPRSRRPS